MKKLKKSMKILLISLTLITMIYSSISYANNDEPVRLVAIEESYEHQQWRALSEEAKAEVLEPAYTTLDFKGSVKRSTYNNLSTAQTDLGERYTLNGMIVKNQQFTGACWAFAASSMIETTLSKKYNKTSEEYSPMHMDYYTANIYNREVGKGGHFEVLTGYLANGYGPVYEDDLSFESVYDPSKVNLDNLEEENGLASVETVDVNKTPRAKVEDTTYFASIYKSYNSDTGEITYTDSSSIWGATTYTDEEVTAMRNLIKQQIKEDGAVAARCYMDETIYYNEATNSYYYDVGGFLTQTNHAVTIIGWDDTYSKENFASTEEEQPANDGAYIVLNSYGTSFGENGIFYVSYDDAAIETQIMGIDEIRDYSEEEKDYNNLYSHSPLGKTVDLTLINDTFTGYLPTVHMANVYQRKDTTVDEYLNKVAIYVPKTEGIKVYINPDGDSFDNLTLIGDYTGTNALTPGYHTIEVNPTKLTSDKFIVAVKYIYDDNTLADGVQVSLESNYKSIGITTEEEHLTDTVVSAEEESYISLDGSTWNDLEGYKTPMSAEEDENGELVIEYLTFRNTNACIDAFTTVQEPVTSTPVTGVTLDKTSASIEVDETVTLTATVNPTDATNKNVTWTSSDEDVATVLGGVVTGKSAGTTTITVTTEDGDFTATCEVTVTASEVEIVAVTGVTLNKTTATIREGASVTLTATVNPTNATNQKITWTSSDEDVATVLGGVVTGKSAGTTTITVTTEEGDFTATCEVTVEETTTSEEVKVTGVTLNKTTATIKKGATTTLVATITPSNAKNKNVTWTSSDEDIATVSETGVVVGESEGTATITVTTEDGDFTATCEVTVEGTTISEEVKVTGVSLNKTTATIKKGATTTLVATITPATATNKNVKWTSSDADIATVSSSGVVTGKSTGTATITVTTEDGGHIATCKVTVEEAATVVPVTSVSLNITSASIQEGETKTLVATINPSDATNKNVIWTSSDEEVATVSSSGIVTAKKAGTATITVTTDDGDYTATATITVTKKTNSDDDIYKDDGKDDGDPTYPGTLPETGEKLLIIASIAVVLVAGIVFVVKFKKYNLK